MSDYRSLPVVGEDLNEDEWIEVGQDIELLRSQGMSVNKILNYKGGSTKYIAKINDGLPHLEVRRKLEEIGWNIGPPYHSRGLIVGFKVSKVRKSTEASAWGG